MIRLEPSERKLLGVFVREVLAHPGEDSINTGRRNSKIVQALRSMGYIMQHEDSLTKEAFLAYFEEFPELHCPPEVQELADRFAIPTIHWRRPSGAILSQMPQERGKAYPLLATVFIGSKAGSATWFHELGHMVFSRLDREDVTSLAEATRSFYPVVSSDEVADAADPDTLQTIPLPKGLYLNINRQYCGLDHSGDDEEAVSDEIWAILFAEHCKGVELPADIHVILERITFKLQVGSAEQS